MINECNIIRDILPLYAENMVSSDTAFFVEEHLKGCEACRKEYERTKSPQSVQNPESAVPLQKLSRKMKVKRIQTVALTAIFVIALILSAFAVLDAPIYMPYSEGLVTLEKYGDMGVLLTFDEKVTDYNYRIYDDPDDGNLCYCDIEAWTSLWDKWFSQGKERLSATVVSGNKPMLMEYIPNDGSENICLARYDPYAENQIETDIDFEHGITLPRLALGYYLILASVAGAAVVVVWFIVRKKAGLRVWIERIGLYPVAYIVSHCIVTGINFATYSISRDFSLIVFISIFLYIGMLLAHNVWYLKMEIKEINR